jgi:hypothetical protein
MPISTSCAVDPVLVDRRRPLLRAVLGPFLRAEDRLGAAGDDPLHQLRIAAEGWRALAGVEDAESPRGAGADVEEAPAGAEGVLDAADGAGDLFALRGDRVRDSAVLSGHDIDDLERRGEVDVGRARVAVFGDARVERSRRHARGRSRVAGRDALSPPDGWG